MFSNVIEKWKKFVDQMNSHGIPVPTARDPKTKTGSVTFSLVCVSAGLCGISILIMLGTSVAKLKSDFNLTAETAAQIHDAFTSSLEFLGMSLGAYLGRKFQSDGKGAVSIDDELKK
jgi:hypothetical protein